jgi:uncharacterized surface protein with fasciclin (FAS1) repeats
VRTPPTGEDAAAGTQGTPLPSVTEAPPTGNAPGSTAVADVYGPACDQVPAQGEGSTQGMLDDPVGTAAANNSLLSRLVTALQKAGLTDTLNAADASYTVFAPANTAFDNLSPEMLQQLLTDRAGLTDILTYHVVPQRYDAEGLAQAGTVMTVQGSPLVISGEPGSLVIDEQQQARVLCGNIPTANATVFVIDQILLPEV